MEKQQDPFYETGHSISMHYLLIIKCYEHTLIHGWIGKLIMSAILFNFKIIDSHTGGEPTRMVYEGFPNLNGYTIQEKLHDFKQNFDHLRQSIILEPRGNDVLVGALLCEPTDPRAKSGVIFFNNCGYLGMCGHGTIGVIASLAY